MEVRIDILNQLYFVCIITIFKQIVLFCQLLEELDIAVQVDLIITCDVNILVNRITAEVECIRYVIWLILQVVVKQHTHFRTGFYSGFHPTVRIFQSIIASPFGLVSLVGKFHRAIDIYHYIARINRICTFHVDLIIFQIDYT